MRKVSGLHLGRSESRLGVFAGDEIEKGRVSRSDPGNDFIERVAAGDLLRAIPVNRLHSVEHEPFDFSAVFRHYQLFSELWIRVDIPNFSITFGGLGIEKNKHSIGHALYNEADPTGWENSEAIREFHIQLIARTMKTLDAVPEGDGTLLDRTVIVYLSDGAETHHSKCYEWPMVVIGRAGGKLKAGRYLQYPDYQKKGYRTINTVYNTLLHAAEVAGRDEFGFLAPHLEEEDHRGLLSEWLA